MKPREFFCQSAMLLPCLLANSNVGTLRDHKISILPYDGERETIFYGYNSLVLFFAKNNGVENAKNH